MIGSCDCGCLCLSERHERFDGARADSEGACFVECRDRLSAKPDVQFSEVGNSETRLLKRRLRSIML